METEFQVGDIVKAREKLTATDDCVVDPGPFRITEFGLKYNTGSYGFFLTSLATSKDMGWRRIECFTLEPFYTAVRRRRHAE